MFKWLQKLLGVAPVEPAPTPVVEPVKTPEPAPAPAPAKEKAPAAPKKETAKKTPAKKAAPKKAAAKTGVDIESMKKADLLAHAKTVGAKANASMKKEEIIAAIKSA